MGPARRLARRRISEEGQRPSHAAHDVVPETGSSKLRSADRLLSHRPGVPVLRRPVPRDGMATAGGAWSRALPSGSGCTEPMGLAPGRRRHFSPRHRAWGHDLGWMRLDPSYADRHGDGDPDRQGGPPKDDTRTFGAMMHIKSSSAARLISATVRIVFGYNIYALSGLSNGTGNAIVRNRSRQMTNARITCSFSTLSRAGKTLKAWARDGRPAWCGTREAR